MNTRRQLLTAGALGVALFTAAPAQATCKNMLCFYPFAAGFGQDGLAQCSDAISDAWDRIFHGDPPWSCPEAGGDAKVPPYHLFSLKRFDGKTQTCGFSKRNGSGDYACYAPAKGWYSPYQVVNGRQLSGGGARFIAFRNPSPGLSNEIVIRFVGGGEVNIPPDSVLTEFRGNLGDSFAGGNLAVKDGDYFALGMSVPSADAFIDQPLPEGMVLPNTARDAREMGAWAAWTPEFGSQAIGKKTDARDIAGMSH